MGIVLLIAQIFLTRFFSWSLKGQIKTLKKSGKMGYSPESVIEFFEESFVETTSENKTEHKYSAVERISVYYSSTVIDEIPFAMMIYSPCGLMLLPCDFLS